MNILELDKNVQKVRDVVREDEQWGFEKTLNEFIAGTYLGLTPQAYGIRLEKYIKYKIGPNCESVNSKLGRGDLKYNNKYIEVKASIITFSNKSLNMVQVRENQEIDYYVFAGFDKRDSENVKAHVFLLTKPEIISELKELNASSAHGTKEVAKQNKIIEKRISLKFDDNNKHFKRWKRKYSVNLDDLYILI